MNVRLGRDRLTKLALRMKSGDARAAELIYNDLLPKVFGFCMSRVGRRELAEDLTQEVFLKLVGKISLFDEKKGIFPVWFWNIARNTLTDYYREKKESSFSDFEEGELDGIAVQSETNLEYKYLMRFIESLPKDEKDLFELRYISDLSYSEISKILGRPEGSLRVMAARLRQKIKNKFK